MESGQICDKARQRGTSSSAPVKSKTKKSYNMKQNAPFLPRLKMTRHLSTIVEGREDNDEFGDVGGLFGRPGENRHRRFSRRVYSCSDITVAANKKPDNLILPPLANPEKNERQSLHGNGKGPRGNLKVVDCTANIFPDFRPPDRTQSIMDFDSKVSRLSTRSKSNDEHSSSQNKENIVASWLQFFG